MDGVKTPTVSLVQSTQTNEITYCSKGNFLQLYYKFPRKFVRNGGTAPKLVGQMLELVGHLSHQLYKVGQFK